MTTGSAPRSMDDATETNVNAPPAPRWPWACLAAALIGVALVRVPLVLNADVHLDSDLAVDGLTLLEATRGHWRLHFPGTPYIGTPPVWLSLPGAWLFGANPRTLVVGGVIAYELVVVATFLLAWRAFGPSAAAWSLVPLAFASVGTVWLSGRISGGHLLTLAWHTAALALVPRFGMRGGFGRAFGYGIFCGLGFYLDGMFLMTLPVVALLFLQAVAQARANALWKIVATVVAVAGFALGDAPREIGARIDPHDAYGEQFATIFERDAAGRRDPARERALLIEHLRLFALECIPRLITGHRLVSADLPTEPRPASLPGGVDPRATEGSALLSVATVAVVGGLFFAAMIVLAASALRPREPGAPNLAGAAILSAAMMCASFLINKNIFNSDNYRYLVYLLTPWCLGFGRMMGLLTRRGPAGKAAPAILSLATAALVALDTAAWYRGFGWIDERGVPVRRPLDDTALAWLRDHRDIDGFFGGYWDVYRYQFLLGGTPAGLPFPNYPDRYNAAGLYPNRQPRIMVARRGELNNFYIRKALDEGARLLLDGRDRLILDWPRP